MILADQALKLVAQGTPGRLIIVQDLQPGIVPGVPGAGEIV